MCAETMDFWKLGVVFTFSKNAKHMQISLFFVFANIFKKHMFNENPGNRPADKRENWL